MQLFDVSRHYVGRRVLVTGHSGFKGTWLSLWLDRLGAKVRVPTLGGAVEMNIPAGSSSGRKLRLPGKGLGGRGRRGDQLVRLMIQVPSTVTDDQRELWEKLAAASDFNPRTF